MGVAMSEVQALFDKIMLNENDPRQNRIIETLDEAFGVDAVRQWIESLRNDPENELKKERDDQ
jgi:hypothetical protein